MMTAKQNTRCMMERIDWRREKFLSLVISGSAPPPGGGVGTSGYPLEGVSFVFGYEASNFGAQINPLEPRGGGRGWVGRFGPGFI